MGFLSGAQLQQSRVQGRSTAEDHVSTPTFTEATALSFKETWANENLSSDALMKHNFQADTQNELENMRSEGIISEDEWDQFSVRGVGGKHTDWEGLANYSNAQHGTEYDLSEETMHAQHRAETDERQRRLAKVEGLDNVGSFLGAMGAVATDPLQAPLLFTPMGAMRFGATTMGTITKMALKEGAINVGLESVIQLNTAQFKEKVGLKYHLSDGATTLLAAFVLGGGVGGGRAGYRIYDGDISISHAIEANDVLIEEMANFRGPQQPKPSTEGAPFAEKSVTSGDTIPLIKPAEGRLGIPTSPTQMAFHEDLSLTQMYLKELAKDPKNANISARDAYQLAWKKFEAMNYATALPDLASTAEVTAHVDAQPNEPKGPDMDGPGELPTAMVPDNTPLRTFSEKDGISDPTTPRAEGEAVDPDAPPQTMGELRAREEATLKEVADELDTYVECRRG